MPRLGESALGAVELIARGLSRAALRRARAHPARGRRPGLTLPFVPESFTVPAGLAGPAFRLVALGPEHNASDHAAWSASIAHIRATPGFAGHDWPPVQGMSLDENRADLERHARDFADRAGFTYTVLAPETDDVLGCVYIYPSRDARTTPTCARGCARTWPSSTCRSTPRSAAGWRRTGRSRRSITRAGVSGGLNGITEGR